MQSITVGELLAHLKDKTANVYTYITIGNGCEDTIRVKLDKGFLFHKLRLWNKKMILINIRIERDDVYLIEDD